MTQVEAAASVTVVLNDLLGHIQTCTGQIAGLKAGVLVGLDVQISILEICTLLFADVAAFMQYIVISPGLTVATARPPFA